MAFTTQPERGFDDTCSVLVTTRVSILKGRNYEDEIERLKSDDTYTYKILLEALNTNLSAKIGKGKYISGNSSSTKLLLAANQKGGVGKPQQPTTNLATAFRAQLMRC